MHDKWTLIEGWTQRGASRAWRIAVHRLLDDQIDADLTERHAGRAADRRRCRAASPSRAAAAKRSGRTSVESTAISSEVSAVPACPPTCASLSPPGPQRVRVVDLEETVVLGDEMRARRRRCPFAIQPRGHGLQVGLRVAAVADQHHVDEAVLLEAAAAGFEHGFENVLGNRDRSGESHVPAGWCDAPLGHIREDRRHESVTERLGQSCRPAP